MRTRERVLAKRAAKEARAQTATAGGGEREKGKSVAKKAKACLSAAATTDGRWWLCARVHAHAEQSLSSRSRAQNLLIRVAVHLRILLSLLFCMFHTKKYK